MSDIAPQKELPVNSESTSDKLANITLSSLGNISVRLQNCCGNLTLFKLLSMGESGRAEIPNYGKKTEIEFLSLMKNYGVDVVDYSQKFTNLIEEVAPPSYNLLKSDIENIDVWITLKTSSWLRNNIVGEIQDRSVKEIANSLCLNWPTSGSANELKISDILNLLPEKIFDNQKNGGLGKTKRRIAFLCVVAVAEGIDSLSVDYKSDLLAHPIFASLNGRQNAILHQRLLTNEPKTLEEIAQIFGLSRERIRQEESNLLSKIACSSLKPILDNIVNSILFRVSSNSSNAPYLMMSELGQFFRAFSKVELLAIYTAGFSTLNDWLSANFIERKIGYVLISKDSWKETEIILSELGQISRPILLKQISVKYNINPVFVEAYLKVNRLADILGEFAVSVGDGKALCRRAIRCHHIAALQNRLGWTFADFFDQNQIAGREARLVKTAITESSTLFASTSVSFCCLLNKSFFNNITSDIMVDSAELDSTAAFGVANFESEKTQMDTILEYVETKWPVEGDSAGYSKFREFLTNPIIYENTYSSYLANDPRIIRLSPGLFAPSNYEKSINYNRKTEKAYELALDESTIRAFLFARRSEENCSRIFPLWNDQYEACVVKFLSKRNEDDLLWESCVSVCKINEYIDDNVELAFETRRVTAQFRLSPSWLTNRSYVAPDLRSVLAIAACALDSGSLSWISANKLLGSSYLVEERGINAIILLSALGILDPVDKWWLPIKISNKSKDVFSFISQRLSADYQFNWSSPEIREILISKNGNSVGVRDATYQFLLESSFNL